jgi:hypothetical protein
MKKINQLDNYNIIHLYDLSKDIDKNLENSRNNEVIIKNIDTLDNKKDSLEYLKNNDIIIKYEYIDYCEGKNGEYYEDIIHLYINIENFNKFYKKLTELWREKKHIIINDLEEQESIKFLKKECCLKFGNKKCTLPPYKNEYELCKVVFEYKLNEPIDWSEIAEKMDEHTPPSKRTMYDTVNRINKRVVKELGIPRLFMFKNHTITRLK